MDPTEIPQSQENQSTQQQQPSEAPAWLGELMRHLREQTKQQIQEAVAPLLAQQTAPQPSPDPQLPPAPHPPTQNIEAQRTRQKLAHVDKFEGKRREYRAWKSQIWVKLAGDFQGSTDLEKFLYVYNRLGNTPTSAIETWFHTVFPQGQLNIPNGLERLIQQLDLMYDDPNIAINAANKLRTIRQGPRSFSAYLTDFEKTLLDAGGMAWDDTAKKSWLTNGLSDDIRRARLNSREPQGYTDYVYDLHNTAANMENLRRTTRTIDPPRRLRSIPRQDDHDQMDWESTPNTTQSSATRTKGRRASWVSPNILESRKRDGLCYRCGTKGHTVKGCSLLPAIRPVTSNSTQVDDSLKKVQEISEDESDESEK